MKEVPNLLIFKKERVIMLENNFKTLLENDFIEVSKNSFLWENEEFFILAKFNNFSGMIDYYYGDFNGEIGRAHV